MKDDRKLIKFLKFKPMPKEELKMILNIAKKDHRKEFDYFEISDIAILIFIINITSPFLAISIIFVSSLFA